MSRQRSVVVGGGLAGLAAALDLAERGHEVTVLEARPRLGGATSSFTRGDLVVDTGQHVFLRCYSAYRGFLQRVGTSGSTDVQPRFSVPVLEAGGRSARLSRSRLPLPSPLHLLPSLVGYRLLRPADRARALRGAAALRALDPRDPRLDEQSFGSWLRAHGQRGPATERLWSLFTVAALNAEPDDASLALAATVFSTSLFARPADADIGIPRVPLDALHGAPAATALRRLGASVRTGVRVRAVRPTVDGYEVQLDDGTVPADGVVVAVTPAEASALLPPAAHPPQQLDALGSAPIVNAHVVYDRPVTALPFAAAVDSPAQWFFDRTVPSGLARGQYLAVSVSAAAELVDTPTSRLREVFLPEMTRLLPRARHAHVTDFFVTRERRATFRQAPGTAGLRPPARTPMPGLTLAGAWTDTGWPDTMEGAVRSGHEAARTLAGTAHTAARRTADDTRPGVVA